MRPGEAPILRLAHDFVTCDLERLTKVVEEWLEARKDLHWKKFGDGHWALVWCRPDFQVVCLGMHAGRNRKEFWSDHKYDTPGILEYDHYIHTDRGAFWDAVRDISTALLLKGAVVECSYMQHRRITDPLTGNITIVKVRRPSLVPMMEDEESEEWIQDHAEWLDRCVESLRSYPHIRENRIHALQQLVKAAASKNIHMRMLVGRAGVPEALMRVLDNFDIKEIDCTEVLYAVWGLRQVFEDVRVDTIKLGWVQTMLGRFREHRGGTIMGMAIKGLNTIAENIVRQKVGVPLLDKDVW